MRMLGLDLNSDIHDYVYSIAYCSEARVTGKRTGGTRVYHTALCACTLGCVYILVSFRFLPRNFAVRRIEGARQVD